MHLSAVDGMTSSHFALKQWQAGERRIALHLTLEAAPDVAEAAGRLCDALAREDTARPVPKPWLHLTMTGIGGAESISESQLEEVAGVVFEEWPRFSSESLIYDGVFVAHESVMLLARNDAWLQELAAIQRAAVDAVLEPRTWREFWPHTSVAYLTGETSAESLGANLASVAADLPDQVEAQPTLTLLELGRDTGMYEWTVLKSAGPKDASNAG